MADHIGGSPSPSAPAAKAPPPGRHHGKLVRIGVGALVSILVISVLYGPNNAFMALGLAVVCTAGIGLIPLLFLSWIVGWIVLAVWDAFTDRRKAAVAT